MKKKYINRMLGVVLLLTMMFACKEELIVDEVINGYKKGAVLRNLGETNGLDISDASSTYSIELEFQEGAGTTDLLKEVKVKAGYYRKKIIDGQVAYDTLSYDSLQGGIFRNYETIPASAFDKKSEVNDLPVATFSVTMAQLAANAELPVDTLQAGDIFPIEFEIHLTDGRVYGSSSATDNVSSPTYFNSPFSYNPEIGNKNRVVFSSAEAFSSTTKGSNFPLISKKSQQVDTIYLEFNTTDALVTLPTVTRITSKGETNDEVGALVDVTVAKKKDKRTLMFTYKVGDLPSDTISFVIEGAEKAAGYPMAKATLKDFYIIDNQTPEADVKTTLTVDDKGQISNVRLDFGFNEKLGKDSVIFTFRSAQFDEVKANKGEKVAIAAESTSITLDFVPKNGDALLSAADGVAFEVITDEGVTEGAGIVDLVGNEEIKTYSIQIGSNPTP